MLLLLLVACHGVDSWKVNYLHPLWHRLLAVGLHPCWRGCTGLLLLLSVCFCAVAAGGAQADAKKAEDPYQAVLQRTGQREERQPDKLIARHNGKGALKRPGAGFEE